MAPSLAFLPTFMRQNASSCPATGPGCFLRGKPNSSMRPAALQADGERAILVDIEPLTCYIREQRSGLGAEAVTRRSVNPICHSEGRRNTIMEDDHARRSAYGKLPE